MEYPKVVYAMQHRVTKKMYIGITNDLKERYKAHLSLLRNNKHTSAIMQKEYNEHGGLYDLFVLDDVNSYSDRYKEYEWMDYYKSNDKNYGYNAQDRGRIENKKIPLKEGKPERICD